MGLGWLGIGFVGYAIYRRRFVHVPMRETVKAPPALGPALALEYRRMLVPVVARAGVGRRAGRRLQAGGGAAVARSSR